MVAPAGLADQSPPPCEGQRGCRVGDSGTEGVVAREKGEKGYEPRKDPAGPKVLIRHGSRGRGCWGAPTENPRRAKARRVQEWRMDRVCFCRDKGLRIEVSG